MTSPEATPSSNVAGDSAIVGMQAGTVHGDVQIYQVPPGATPAEKYRFGVDFLHGGMPARARELIDDAVIGGGHRTSESYFHWLLALLSGRTLQQMSSEDFSKLSAAPQLFLLRPDDEWMDGVRLIWRLLHSLKTPGADPRVVEKEFEKLGDAQRDMIMQHLELFLKGPLQDRMWMRAFELAQADQTEAQRRDRVWRFFHPKPAEARVRLPRTVTVTIGHWLGCGAATAVFVVATGVLASMSWRGDRVSTMIGLLLAAVGGRACARNGLEWRFRVLRVRIKDWAYLRIARPAAAAPAGGFAEKIDHQFQRYFASYVPAGVDRGVWIAQTAGIRRTMRDEIAEIYRESQIDAERVAWLVRYLVSDVGRRWQAGTLLEHRVQLETPGRVKAAAIAGAATSVIGGFQVAGSALATTPFTAMGTTLLVVGSGWLTTLAWSRVFLERRRFAAEHAEAQRRLADRRAAFDRWSAKLARKPSDAEMAHWLDCDRKVLMNRAMQHYKLAASDVIAHAVLEAPAAPFRRARVLSGPWRYSRYTILIFLLTEDGVRQVIVHLDFREASFHDWQRLNYRFEAVSAVRVAEPDSGQKTFELGLIDGQSISVPITGPDPSDAEQGERFRTISKVTLDAAGIGSTLHVLEGIAAAGKEWIAHERRREEDRLGMLTEAAQNLMA